MIKVCLVVPKISLNIYVILLLGFISTSCNQPDRSSTNAEPIILKVLNKQTLVTMVEKLHRSLNVKDYTLDKSMDVLRPYLSQYKICIPGFSKIVPYDESYLYIYCIYDAKQTPLRLLSFRFELPKQLAQQLTLKDISKSFKTWKLEGLLNKTDSTTTTSYNAGGKNLSIQLIQYAQPNQVDSIITEVIVYH